MSQDVRPDAPTAHVATARRAPLGDGSVAVPPQAPAPNAESGPPGRYQPYGPGGAAPFAAPAGYGPPVGYGPPGPATTRPTEGTAIGALVCGFLVAPVGVVLGIVALRRIKRRGTGGKGLAIGGLVVGTLLTLVTVALVVGVAALIATGVGGSSTTDCTGSVCETTVYGTPISVDDVGGENGKRFVVVSVAEGAVQVQGDADPTPTSIPAGTSFTVDGQPVDVVSATGGRAVFRYHH